MTWWGRLLHRDRLDRELDAELQFHFELQVAEKVRSGMSEGEARRRCRLEFGGMAQVKEHCRETRGTAFVEQICQDVRYAIRMWIRNPGFNLVIVMTLGLGIGANTAVFSLINAALLRALPVRNPQELVQFSRILPPKVQNDYFSYPELELFQHENSIFSGVFAFAGLDGVNVEVNGHGGIANGQIVSGNYFSTLGIPAILGRVISPADDQSVGRSAVAVISYKYWRERLAGDPAVVGAKILINNFPFTIVGVTGPEFYGLQPGQAVDISVPLKMVAPLRPDYALTGTRYDVLTWPSRNAFLMMGRLQPGVTATAAAVRMEPLFRLAMKNEATGLVGTAVDLPGERENHLHARLHLMAGGRGLSVLREQFSKPLLILMAAVGLLLLIACANIATLLLARAQFRQREMAARLVLGARRRRLMQQLLTESALLALVGGVFGIALAFWASGWLMALMRHMGSPFVLPVRPDLRVLGFTLAISVLTAILFGLIPSWQLVQAVMLSGPVPTVHSTLRSTRRPHTTRVLIALQVAASLVLMVGAGLLARSLQNIRNIYPGFRTDNVLLFSVNARLLGYTIPQTSALYQRLIKQIDTLPGIRKASFSLEPPISGDPSYTIPMIEGYQAPSGSGRKLAGLNAVGPQYFSALEIPVLRGREFTEQDNANAPKVAVINERMARDIFRDVSPMGRRLSVPAWSGDKSWYSIVGVVADAKSEDLRDAVVPTIYLPAPQMLLAHDVTFEVRTARDASAEAPAVVQTIAQIDGRLSVAGMKTLNNQMDDFLVQERLVASLASLFGVLALLLAAVGLYGVMAYTVSRKTNEIGIRMALGSGRLQIAKLVLRDALLMVLVGIGLGIPAAMATAHLMRSQLYGLGPNDLITMLSAVGVMICVTVLACLTPATRAMRVNSIVAIRYE